ncbi:MAG: helix-turn-helix transcriptional regulator [Gammaproteobacteria bacterium]|jgi:AraC family transcriptional regulator|nr:helix-turn-helix transcriptional regulator [Gammaproteobacteria bacterium]
MALKCIAVEELPKWVPGQVLLGSDDFQWGGTKLRAYRYQPSDVEVPPLQDFMIVAYNRGATSMDREIDGKWTHKELVPGDVSLLTRAWESHWAWQEEIDVFHVYLGLELVDQVCRDVFDREIIDVHFEDVLKISDPVLFNGAVAIANEVTNEQVGGEILVDTIARQMCIHILRKYSTISFNEVNNKTRCLSIVQARRTQEFIEENLDQSLTLEQLAKINGVGVHYFIKLFKTRFGCPPHVYICQRRIERAQELLRRTDFPIKDIALRTGYSDQSHMTRHFQRFLNTTPKAFRKSTEK